MGFLPVRGPALGPTHGYPKLFAYYAEDVGRNV